MTSGFHFSSETSGTKAGCGGSALADARWRLPSRPAALCAPAPPDPPRRWRRPMPELAATSRSIDRFSAASSREELPVRGRSCQFEGGAASSREELPVRGRWGQFEGGPDPGVARQGSPGRVPGPFRGQFACEPLRPSRYRAGGRCARARVDASRTGSPWSIPTAG